MRANTSANTLVPQLARKRRYSICRSSNTSPKATYIRGPAMSPLSPPMPMVSSRYGLYLSAAILRRVVADNPPQELYEPLWEDLVSELGKYGVGVRGIWIADVAWQGQSGIVNEDKIGNDRELSASHPRLASPRLIGDAVLKLHGSTMPATFCT